MTLNSSHISLLIRIKRQDIVLMCNISGPVAEQRSPQGRIHNPLKGEESQRGFGRSPFAGWETIPVWRSASLINLFPFFMFHFTAAENKSRWILQESWSLWSSYCLRFAQTETTCQKTAVCIWVNNLMWQRYEVLLYTDTSLLLMRHLEHSLI